MQFPDSKPGNQQLVSMLTKKNKLNSGNEFSYANGIVLDAYRGWRQYSHGGADAGYRTYLSVLPDLKMGFMVFSNLGDVDAGGMAYAFKSFCKGYHIKKLQKRQAYVIAQPQF